MYKYRLYTKVETSMGFTCILPRENKPIEIETEVYNRLLPCQKYSTRGVVSKAIQHSALPRAVWLSRPHLSCCISRTARGTVL